MLRNERGISLISLVLIAVIVIVIGFVIVVTVTNKDDSINEISSELGATDLNESTNNDSETTEKIENDLVPGVEYYAPERDIDGVTSKKFSFFIGNEHQILTYINEDENSNIKVSSHNFRENSVGVIFNVNEIDIVVSDDKYHRDGELMNYENKTLVSDENGMKYYTAPYKNGYYVHYFETNIDEVPVSLYAVGKTEIYDPLLEGVQELISKLSINDRVGLWADNELSSNFAREGIALKSSKLFSYLPVSLNYSSEKIMVNGYEVSVTFSIYSWRNNQVNDSRVVMGEIAGQKYGYYTSENSDGNTDLYVNIYKSEMIGDEEYYTNSPTIFLLEKLNETDLTPEQAATMIMDQVIEITE